MANLAGPGRAPPERYVGSRYDWETAAAAVYPPGWALAQGPVLTQRSTDAGHIPNRLYHHGWDMCARLLQPPSPPVEHHQLFLFDIAVAGGR
ncbi:hypothetical protein ACFVWN_00975 [Nocardiopsis flavescens]|uniref:hypothetical protein n=1 Tax=Nocardiopsis flavescens TaxID=758803 RepID=UPI00365FAEC0